MHVARIVGFASSSGAKVSTGWRVPLMPLLSLSLRYALVKGRSVRERVRKVRTSRLGQVGLPTEMSRETITL